VEFDKTNLTQKYNFWDEVELPDDIKKIILLNIKDKNIIKDLLKFIITEQKELINVCWLWRAGTDKNGYGKKNGIAAHRISWIYSRSNRDIPNNKIIRHTCDNPPCVNPFHLRCGTIQDNANDMKNRNRSLLGEKHPDASFKDEEVKQILYELYLGKSIVSLAKKYNVLEIVISKIANGHTWKHIYSQLQQEHIDQIQKNSFNNQIRNKLNEQQVIKIRELYDTGKYTYTNLAKQFGTRITTISNIVNYISWNHI